MLVNVSILKKIIVINHQRHHTLREVRNHLQDQHQGKVIERPFPLWLCKLCLHNPLQTLSPSKSRDIQQNLCHAHLQTLESYQCFPTIYWWKNGKENSNSSIVYLYLISIYKSKRLKRCNKKVMTMEKQKQCYMNR